MKKHMLGILLMFIPCAIFAAIGEMWSVGSNTAGDDAATVDSSGNMNVKNNLTVTGTLTVDGGLVNARDVFNDVPAASDNGYFDVDIATTALVAAATTYTGTKITQPYKSINVTAVCTFDLGVATTTVAGSLVTTGVNARGVPTTETLAISTTNATGNVAWSSITSLAWTITSITGREYAMNASLQVGPGLKLGLSNAIAAADDVLGVMFDDSGTTTNDTTYTASTTYNTIQTTTAGDGTTDNITVVYTVDAK